MSTSGKDGSGGTPASGTGEAAVSRGGARSLIPGTIRGKLFLVFAIVFLSAAASAIIAQRANVLVQQQLSSITEDNLPSLVFAHEVSAVMTNIRGVAAALATAETGPALSSRRGQLKRHIDNAKAVINGLDATGVDRQTEARLNRFVADVEELATELASTVEMRLQLDEQLSEKIQGLAGEYTKFNASIAPLVSQQLQFLGTESERVTANTEKTVSRLNDISFKGLIPLLSINAQLATMKEALRVAFEADAETRLDDAWSDFVASSSVITRNLRELRGNAAVSDAVDVETLEDGFGDILAVGIGDDSIFERKRQQLAQEGAIQVDAAQETSQLEASLADLERQLKLAITLIRGQTVNVGIGLNRQVSDSLDAINQASVDGYGALLKLEALGNRAVGLLSVAPFVQEVADLEPLRTELEASEAEVASILDRLGTGAEVSATADLARRLMEFGRGETGVFELRANELQALEQVADLLFRTNALTQQMSVSAAEIVANAREMTDAAATTALGSLDSSRLTLSLVIGVSLLTMLGAIVYVNRSLGSRLSAFSNATLALAEGDLSVKLPEATGRDEVARLMRALSVFRDTAAEMQRSNLREIAEARQQLVDAIESISEGFAIFDRDDRLLIANTRYREIMLGDRNAPLQPGASFADIVRRAAASGRFPDAEPDPDTWVERQISRHHRLDEPSIQVLAGDRWQRISNRRTEEGGIVAIHSDITELKRVSDELLRAKEAADAANEAKTAFLAAMSHEIRTPLNGIVGMSRLLGETKLDAEQRDFTATIIQAADTLLAIINDILDFSKVEAGAMEIEQAPMDLHATVEVALELVAAKAAEKKLELACQIEPNVPAWIIGDSVRVKQILLNLLNNAVKFTQAGEIVLAVSVLKADSERPERLGLSVRDTGIGIPKDRMDRLFRSFSQVDASTSRRFGGTGLGLAIAKRLVELMGGAIEVESEEGVGTMFSFSIPLQAASPSEDERRDAWLTGLQGRRALVVDDNRTNRRILERQLGAWGLDVSQTGSPREALDWIAGGAEFDVCVIDYLMPKMDGLELAQRIRQEKGQAAPPIILCSASTPSGSEFRQKVAGMAFSAVLTKPAKSRHLLKALHDAVRPDADESTPAKTEKPKATEAACRPDGAPLTMLVVDDNRINQKVASKILARLGYAPDIVSSGEEAVRACMAGRYDVVLMDIEMPEMDGIAATALIRQKLPNPEQPYVVALTANAMAQERERYLRSGLDDYLSKPLDVGALNASLRTAAGFLSTRGQGAWTLEVEDGRG